MSHVVPSLMGVPVLHENLPDNSKITDIEIINYGKQIRVSAITPSGIKHLGFLNIPDKYSVEFFYPPGENVVVLFWRYGPNVVFVDNYDM